MLESDSCADGRVMCPLIVEQMLTVLVDMVKNLCFSNMKNWCKSAHIYFDEIALDEIALHGDMYQHCLKAASIIQQTGKD